MSLGISGTSFGGTTLKSPGMDILGDQSAYLNWLKQNMPNGGYNTPEQATNLLNTAKQNVLDRNNGVDPDANNNGSWWNGGTLGKIAGTVMNNLDGIAGISNSILGWKQYAQNRKLINKQMENIDEQIAASKEYRQQRRDEIARLNRIRNNTQKSFNTGTTITRSY